MEVFPDDIPLTFENIRSWAAQNRYVTDPEFQFISKERILSFSKCITSEDNLQIALAIHPGDGEPFYMEYPYLSVKDLIRRGETVKLAYWQMKPTRWDADGNILKYGETRFGFYLPGCHDEFCSVSTAKRVVEKLGELLLTLSKSDKFIFKEFSDGSKEITVDGEVSAKFYKDGRFYDVEFEDMSSQL